MVAQNQVILSLGSNQGNRLQNIQECLSFIHQKIGTVIKVSKLYETPAWGFESNPFYNCVLMLHSSKKADQVLSEILALEEELGRVRINQEGYQSRVIDIDVIAFNEEIIKTEKLQVPHPLMQDRLFVLIPMKDLQLDWRHPILQQYLHEMVLVSADKSSCKMITSLDIPLAKIKLKAYNYIAIEGNIGAGKTTLSYKIAQDFNAKLVLERFADNPFLPKFYEDQSRYAFPLEMSFLADRYQQLMDDLSQFDLFKEFVVADYHIFKSIIFAKVTLGEDEYRLYKTMFDIMRKEMAKPDLYIYLYQNTATLLKNIQTRGRDYEQQISKEYLEKINQGYLDFIKTQTDLNVLVVDVSDKDFLANQEDYVFILNAIQEKMSV